MKRVFWFLLWWWRKLDAWQKGWMAAAFLFGAGLGASDPYRQYLIGAPLIFVCVTALKWMLWDGIRDEWIRFNKEQQFIIDELKGPK